MINIYAPNKTTEQSLFFHKITDLISNEAGSHKILLGGDFNVILDPSMDAFGGNPAYKDLAKLLDEVLAENDLVDIWRIQNPDVKRFTWMQKTPLIQPRLDYWFIDDSLQDDIAKIDIVTAIRTDHSAVILEIDSLDT